MSWLQPKLHLKVAQKQILTPGLVQMVSVLALNRLELREMINQEMVANPMLEELTEDAPATEQDYSEEAFLKAETEKVPETEAANPFDEFDVAAFFNQYLDSGSGEGRGEHEVIEKPSFDKFISSPQGLSEHLQWQLSVTVCNETVREIAEVIIGNLDENGYLTVSLEEIARNGNYSTEDVEEALAVVQEFDPLGVAARNLRECLLIQLRTLDAQNALAPANRLRMHAQAPAGGHRRRAAESGDPAGQAAAGQSAQGSRAGAESPRRAGQARHGRDSRPRSASRACATTRRRRGWSSPTSISARWMTAGKSS